MLHKPNGAGERFTLAKFDDVEMTMRNVDLVKNLLPRSSLAIIWGSNCPCIVAIVANIRQICELAWNKVTLRGGPRLSGGARTAVGHPVPG